MNMQALIQHVRDGALEWRIQYPPFWQTAFARLKELQAEIGPQEAARLLPLLTKLSLVDMEVVEHCEQTLSEMGPEQALQLRPFELLNLAEALIAVERFRALPSTLRLLVPRVHRLSPAATGRLLKAVLPSAARADEAVGAALQLLDALCQELGDTMDNVPASRVLMATEALAALASVRGAQKWSSGVDFFFKAVGARVRTQPEEMSSVMSALVDAARVAGAGPGTLRALEKALRRGESNPEERNEGLEAVQQEGMQALEKAQVDAASRSCDKVTGAAG